MYTQRVNNAQVHNRNVPIQSKIQNMLFFFQSLHHHMNLYKKKNHSHNTRLMVFYEILKDIQFDSFHQQGVGRQQYVWLWSKLNILFIIQLALGRARQQINQANKFPDLEMVQYNKTAAVWNKTKRVELKDCTLTRVEFILSMWIWFNRKRPSLVTQKGQKKRTITQVN